jgi:hypothetical protein
MEQAGGRPELAAAAREHIDQRIARGMSGDSSGDYVPKGLSVRTRGVGGVTDIGWGAASAQPADMDNVVIGHATAVKKVVLHHR